MMSKTVDVCPLNCRCFDDATNTRCKWFINYPVRDADGNTKEDWRCAVVWTSVLEIELINAVQSLRKKDETKVSH
jgi:hypothetical protein